MAQIVNKDRVKETTTTTGTGTITLAGAASGFRSFTTAHATGDTVQYVIDGGTEWEVGVGVFTAAGTTLSRDTVIASSNAGALVNFSAGTKTVFTSPTAERTGTVLMPPVTLTTQTSVDFTIPAGVKKITMIMAGGSTNGTSGLRIQLGDAGGIETSSYTSGSHIFTGSVAGSTATDGFAPGAAPAATDVINGVWNLDLAVPSTFTWVASGQSWQDKATDVSTIFVGSKSLSQELTTVRLTTVGGTDQFDAGTLTVSYSF